MIEQILDVEKDSETLIILSNDNSETQISSIRSLDETDDKMWNEAEMVIVDDTDDKLANTIFRTTQP